MLTKITLALAFAVGYAVPASAGPRTCGYNTMQYDSSGTWTGPLLRLGHVGRCHAATQRKMAGREQAIFPAGLHRPAQWIVNSVRAW
jgi:hypothetical protein